MEAKENDYPINSSTTDKYFLLEKEINENSSPFEIKVSNNPKKIRSTVSYIIGLINKGSSDHVSIKATGQAISKAVRIAEIVKRKIFDLHQFNKISNLEVQDVYIPEEEGLDEVILKKKISIFEIVLQRKVSEADRKNIGYQPPLDHSQVRAQNQGNRRYRSRIMGEQPQNQPPPPPMKQVKVRNRKTEEPKQPTFYEKNERSHFRGRGATRRAPPNEHREPFHPQNQQNYPGPTQPPRNHHPPQNPYSQHQQHQHQHLHPPPRQQHNEHRQPPHPDQTTHHAPRQPPMPRQPQGEYTGRRPEGGNLNQEWPNPARARGSVNPGVFKVRGGREPQPSGHRSRLGGEPEYVRQK